MNDYQQVKGCRSKASPASLPVPIEGDSKGFKELKDDSYLRSHLEAFMDGIDHLPGRDAIPDGIDFRHLPF
jgi:hypothetical protein